MFSLQNSGVAHWTRNIEMGLLNIITHFTGFLMKLRRKHIECMFEECHMRCDDNESGKTSDKRKIMGSEGERVRFGE